MIVAEDYNTPGVKLDLYGGTSGHASGTDKDRFAYGNDANSHTGDMNVHFGTNDEIEFKVTAGQVH